MKPVFQVAIILGISATAIGAGWLLTSHTEIFCLSLDMNEDPLIVDMAFFKLERSSNLLGTHDQISILDLERESAECNPDDFRILELSAAKHCFTEENIKGDSLECPYPINLNQAFESP